MLQSGKDAAYRLARVGDGRRCGMRWGLRMR